MVKDEHYQSLIHVGSQMNLSPNTVPTSPPAVGRWGRFSLRTLVIIMLLSALGWGWLARQRSYHLQQQALASKLPLGLNITWGAPAWLESIGGATWTRQFDVVKGASINDIQSWDMFISPSETQIPRRRASFQDLTPFPEIETLDIQFTWPETTPEELAALQHLPHLHTINVSSFGNKDDDRVEKLRQAKPNAIIKFTIFSW